MIRLGSLAGYPFEGPRLLAGWTPPGTPAVYAIAYKPDSETRPERYAVIYIGHSDDLTAERFPFKHPRSACWVQRAGSRWKVYICTYQVPGGGRAHREQIARELTAIYHPRCNSQQYDQAWKDHWIGEYSAPTTGPLAARDPDDPSAEPGPSPRLPARGWPPAVTRPWLAARGQEAGGCTADQSAAISITVQGTMATLTWGNAGWLLMAAFVLVMAVVAVLTIVPRRRAAMRYVNPPAVR